MITGNRLVEERLYSTGDEELDDLLERAFSEGYEYAQREFGFIQDVKRSGLKRTMKRNVGRLRNKVADKIDDSIEKDFEDYRDSVFKFATGDRVVNNKIERELMKDIKKNNARVVGVDLDGMKGNYTVESKTMKERFGNGTNASGALISNPYYPGANRIKKKIANSIDKGEDVILHPSGSGTEYLGHENGHIKNAKSKNPITRLINKIANKAETREKFTGYASTGLTDDGIGIREAADRFIKSKAIIKEEANASKRSLKDFKRLGATKEELDAARDSLNVGGDTYKKLSSAYYKTPVSNLIHTPGRRNGVGYLKRKGVK